MATINLQTISLGPESGSSAKIEEGVTLSVTANGSYTVSPDEGYDAIADAKVNVNITTPLETWTDTDGMKYAYSAVTSFPSSLSFAPRTGDHAYNMFYTSNITTAPNIDLSGATSLAAMFYLCSNLVTVPNYDTSSVTNFSSMFYRCSKLKNAPSLDISSGKNFTNMYYNCSKLVNIQNAFINIPENTCDTYRMFYQCNALKYGSDMLGGIISQSNDVRSMFDSCTSLISATAATIGEWTLNYATDTMRMFCNCGSLVQLPCIDMTNVTSTSQMLDYCSSLQLLYKGGLKNLKCNCNLSTCNALTHDSLVDLFNVIATVTSSTTLTLGSTNLAKLTDEEKAIATGKGWTLA